MTNPQSRNNESSKQADSTKSADFHGLTHSRAPEPVRTGYLTRPGAVGHRVYFEEYGSPDDPPLLLVHGTAIPFNASQLSFLSELKVRAIVFHQRGVGHSEPSGEILENNLDATLGDIEALRAELAIDKWHVLGWSLGSTFSLIYAEQNPDVCKSLVLAGVFLANENEYERVLDAEFRNNPNKFKTMADFLGINFSPNKLADIIEATAKLFHSSDPEISKKAISIWETGDPNQEIDIARKNYLKVNFHYKVNNYFVDSKETLSNVDRISHLPLRIVSGEHDHVVMPESSMTLAASHPDASIVVTAADHFFNSPEGQSDIAEQVSAVLAM